MAESSPQRQWPRWAGPFLGQPSRYAPALLLLILPALWPLLQPGFFVSDDGRFHVYRIAALAQSWQQGVLHPRLFPEFGFGYGQAVLNFYSPLSYWPGALLGLLGVGPAAAAQITIALGFLLAALAAYGYARSLWGPAGGVLAALAYTYFPYHLADAYLRGALPEHLAFIWPPLILWAYTAAFRAQRPLPPLLWGALVWAGLIYTHNLTALLMAPATALYLLVMASWTGRWRRLAAAVGSLALALALSAAYWLPVLAESGSVGVSLGPSDGYQDHLLPPRQLLLLQPFYRYRPGSGADYPLSWLVALLGLLALLLSARRLAQRRALPAGPALGCGFLLLAGAALMTTTLSLPIWRLTAAALAHLQYPWRFLTLAAVGAMMIAAALPSLAPRPGRGLLLALLALALLLTPLPHLSVQPLALPDAATRTPDRMWREDAEAGQVGATWTGEFLPLTVQEQRWALGRPAASAADGPPLSPPPTVQIMNLGHAQIELQIETAAPLALSLHQFHLPGWVAQLDGSTAPTHPTGQLGLVTASVPAGSHRLALRFGPTGARTAGALLSTLAAGLWAGLAILTRRRRSSRWLWRAGLAIAVLTLLLDLNALGLGRRTWQPQPAGARLEDVAILVAADARYVAQPRTAAVTLYWLALRAVATDYKAFVHLLGPDGVLLTQHDGDPVGGFTPTTRWQPGEIIFDRHILPLPPDLPPGRYELRAGLYQLQPLRNLTVSPPAPDDRAPIGSLLIR